MTNDKTLNGPMTEQEEFEKVQELAVKIVNDIKGVVDHHINVSGFPMHVVYFCFGEAMKMHREAFDGSWGKTFNEPQEH